MSKKEQKVFFWGYGIAGLLGGVFKAFLGYTPNVNAIIALTLVSFAFNVAFMVALLVAPVKRVLWDTQDAYFITRLRRLCNLLETSALTSLALCIVLALAPQTIAHNYLGRRHSLSGSTPTKRSAHCQTAFSIRLIHIDDLHANLYNSLQNGGYFYGVYRNEKTEKRRRVRYRIPSRRSLL